MPRRWFIAILLFMGVCLGAEPPHSRFILLVDTSQSMERKQTATLNTIRTLVARGFGGRIEEGESFTIMAFSENLRSQTPVRQVWRATENRLAAEVAAQFVLDEFHYGTSAPEKILREMFTNSAALPGALIVCVTDRSIKGRDFDPKLNAFYSANSIKLTREKRAMVIGFALQSGVVTDVTIGRAGEATELPILPAPAVEIATAPLKEDFQRPSVQPQAQPLIVESKPLPVEKPTLTKIIPPEQAESKPPVVAPAPPRVPVIEPKPLEISSPLQKPVIEPTLITAPPNKPSANEGSAIPDPVKETVTQIAQSTKETVRVEPVEERPVAREIEPTSAVPTAMITPPVSAALHTSRKPLVLALVAALVAGVLSWMILSRMKRRPAPSLITRSFDQNRR